MNRRKTRLNSLVLALLIIVALLAMSSCSTKGAATTAPPETATTATSAPADASSTTTPDASAAAPTSATVSGVTFPLSQKVQINAYVSNLFKEDGTPKLWYQELMKRLNIEFTNTAVAGDDTAAKLLAMIAAGNPPEMFAGILNEQEIMQYGAEGAFLDLKPYMDKGYFPNFLAQAAQAEKTNGISAWKYITTESGAVYNLPGIFYNSQYPWAAINTRVDLLKAQNLPLEGYQDWEAFYDTLLKLHQAYPDHITWDVNNQQIFFDSYLFNTNSSVIYDGTADKFIFAPLYDDFKYYTDYHARMYKDGIMDSNWASRTASDMIATINNGTTIMTVNHPMVTDQQQPYLDKAGITGADLENILPPANTNGKKTLGAPPSPIVTTNWSLVVSSKVTGDKLNVILAFCDYCFSPEAELLDEWGIQGVHWDYDANGKPQFKPDVYSPVNPKGTVNITDEGFFYTSFMMVRTWEATAAYNAGPRFTASNQKYIDGGFLSKTPPPLLFTESETSELNQLNAALNTYVTEQYTAFVTGQKPMDNYQEFLDGLKSMNAQRVEDIYNAAYQRSKAD